MDVVKSPAWCTASGLLVYALAAENTQKQKTKRAPFSVRGVVGNLRGMFSDLL